MLLLGALATVAVLAAAWGFRQVVPAGLRLGSMEPYYLWSREPVRMPSPEGTREVQIVINDAGAMHSGNHWAWVLTRPSFTGQQIIAEGYFGFDDVSAGKLPLKWLSEDEIEVRFRQGRHSAAEATQTFRVP